MIWKKILNWLCPLLDKTNDEIDQTTKDIAFLTNKIHTARHAGCFVIAEKLAASRSELIRKREHLLDRRRLFNN